MKGTFRGQFRVYKKEERTTDDQIKFRGTKISKRVAFLIENQEMRQNNATAVNM